MDRRCGALAAVIVLLLAGCGPAPGRSGAGVPAGCPADDWDAAVIWSSETARSSRVDYVLDDAVVGTQAWPYQGLEPSPDDPSFRHGTDARLYANGDTLRTTTHVLRWSQVDCSVQAFEVEEQVIWDVAADDEALFTINAVDGVSEVHRRTMDGRIASEAEVPSAVFSNLVLDGDARHAIGSVGEPGAEQTVMITFDARTMEERQRLMLGPATTPLSTLLHEGEVYVPAGAIITADGSEQEVSTVVGEDPAAGTSRTVELGAPSPFLVVASPRGPIFAHTYMNPAFRSMDAYGQVTMLDTTTQETTTADLGPGLRHIAVSGDELLVLTQVEGGPARLTTYALADLSEQSSVELSSPSGGRHYLMGILARLPEPHL